LASQLSIDAVLLIEVIVVTRFRNTKAIMISSQIKENSSWKLADLNDIIYSTFIFYPFKSASFQEEFSLI